MGRESSGVTCSKGRTGDSLLRALRPSRHTHTNHSAIGSFTTTYYILWWATTLCYIYLHTATGSCIYFNVNSDWRERQALLLRPVIEPGCKCDCCTDSVFLFPFQTVEKDCDVSHPHLHRSLHLLQTYINQLQKPKALMFCEIFTAVSSNYTDVWLIFIFLSMCVCYVTIVL